MEDLLPPRLAAQLDFLLAADALKGVTRTCLIADGSRCENSAEHSWHVALMAIVLAEHAERPIDIGHVVQMLIAHDLVEVYAGDTLIYDADAVQGQAEREAQAAERLFVLLPPDGKERLRSLWQEFEAHTTEEAKFARAIDALAPTWLQWGEHANPPPDGLTAAQIIAHKTPFLLPYPALFGALNRVVDSAVARGLVTA